MFQSPSSNYDWRFRLFGVPVEVQPFFWLAGLILVGEASFKWTTAMGKMYESIGVEYTGNGLATMLATLVVFFLSILIHEMGHVVAFRRYGIYSRIVLHGFGGVAIPSTQSSRAYRTSRWKDVIIYAAGPFFQAVFLAGLLAISLGITTLHFFPNLPFVSLAPVLATFVGVDWFVVLQLMVYANLFWILFNLLPILPMDGGGICQGFCKDYYGPYQGRVTALWISVVTAIQVAIWLFQSEMMLLALYVGYMGFQSMSELQSGSRGY